jgi:hypothetical protein
MHVVNIETIGLVGFLTSYLTLNVGVKTFLTSNDTLPSPGVNPLEDSPKR